MRFCVENLGPINHAELELGDLTVICGKNNNGKTYLSYTLDSFLDTIDINLSVHLRDSDFSSLLSTGELNIDLTSYIDDFLRVVEDTVPRFQHTLPRFLAMHPDKFQGLDIRVLLTREEIIEKFRREPEDGDRAYRHEVEITETASLTIAKTAASTVVHFVLLNKAPQLPSRNLIENAAAFLLAKAFDTSTVSRIFPKTFIITCERSGASVFRSELALVKAKKRMDAERAHDRGKLYFGYQRPVEKDIEFILDLKHIVQRRSFIAESHSAILNSLQNITGGDYSFDLDTDQVRFIPLGSRQSLALVESSSTVRALAELYFYLAHKAERGQVLMMDEPELNLHPENQRKLARLLIELVNVGLRVYITTHSDYIIREINALIAIKGLHADLKETVMRQFGYSNNDLLDSEKVRGYVLEDGRLISVPANVSGLYAMTSFDRTMSDYLRLYSAIVSAQNTDDAHSED